MDPLPDDLVATHVLRRLDFVARVRFAAVSKPCRTISRLIPFPAMPDMPWMLGLLSHRQSIPTLANFNNGLSVPTLHQPCRPLQSEIMHPFAHVGVVDGYVILCTLSFTYSSSPATTVALYQPFSGETRRIIPHPTGLPSYGLLIKFARILPELGLVVVTDYLARLFICRFGCFDWVNLHLIDVTDFIFHQGFLYCVDRWGNICCFSVQHLLDNGRAGRSLIYRTQDAVGRRVKRNFVDGTEEDVGCGSHGYDYALYNLVESSGDLLLVTRFGCRGDKGSHDRVKLVVRELFLMQQYTSATGEIYVPLVEVNNLGEKILFLKEGCSVSCASLIEPSNFFTQDCIEDDKTTNGYLIGKFSLKSDEIGSEFANFYPPEFMTNAPPLWISAHPVGLGLNLS